VIVDKVGKEKSIEEVVAELESSNYNNTKNNFMSAKVSKRE
jgi:hypothetical protein